MDRARPSVIDTLVWAYWDLYHTLRAAWRSALIATAILSIGVLAVSIGPLLLTRDPIGQALARQVILIGLCFLLTPFFLVVHRLLLLGELTTRYDFTPSSQRFQLFFGWLALSVLMVSIPAFLDAFMVPKGPVYYDSGHPFAGHHRSTIVTAVRLVALIVVQHFLVLFPAVAVDAPGTTWQNAVSDTRRHRWFVLVVTILPFIPVGLLAAAVIPLLRVGPGTLIGLIANMMLLGVMLLVVVTLGAVSASRLYQIIGHRLNMPLRQG